jgi:hypothetical protein
MPAIRNAVSISDSSDSHMPLAVVHVEKVEVEAAVAGGAGLADWSLFMKKRSAASVRCHGIGTSHPAALDTRPGTPTARSRSPRCSTASPHVCCRRRGRCAD